MRGGAGMTEQRMTIGDHNVVIQNTGNDGTIRHRARVGLGSDAARPVRVEQTVRALPAQRRTGARSRTDIAAVYGPRTLSRGRRLWQDLCGSVALCQCFLSYRTSRQFFSPALTVS